MFSLNRSRGKARTIGEFLGQNGPLAGPGLLSQGGSLGGFAPGASLGIPTGNRILRKASSRYSQSGGFGNNIERKLRKRVRPADRASIFNDLDPDGAMLRYLMAMYGG